jgi:hypothetical protein
MKNESLQTASVSDLTERFLVSALAQFEAELKSNIRKQNKCVEEQMAIAAELKSRPGDQRSALFALYEHSNVQVRLNAARLTFAVAPKAARDIVQAIVDSRRQPQAMDAGMCLKALDQGIFKPT